MRAGDYAKVLVKAGGRSVLLSRAEVIANVLMSTDEYAGSLLRALNCVNAAEG